MYLCNRLERRIVINNYKWLFGVKPYIIAIIIPPKSYRHPALRESALACVVYDDLPILVCKDSDYFAQNEEIYENFWNSQKKFLSLQRERRSQVEPRCAERWHGWRVKPTEMMSNSTLPLGFLHSSIELVTCGQLFKFYDTWAT